MSKPMRKDVNRYHVIHTMAGAIAGFMGLERVPWFIMMTIWEVAEMTIFKGSSFADPPETQFDRVLDVIVGFLGREAGVVVRNALEKEGFL